MRAKVRCSTSWLQSLFNGGSATIHRSVSLCARRPRGLALLFETLEVRGKIVANPVCYAALDVQYAATRQVIEPVAPDGDESDSRRTRRCRALHRGQHFEQIGRATC